MKGGEVKTVSKRYYWLKLKEDFFEDERITLIFKEARGKEILLVYIRLLLKSIRKEGILRYADARAYTDLELARLTGFSLPLTRLALKTLTECGLVTRDENGTLLMNDFQEMVGSEGESASKMRKSRKNKESLCDHNVTESKSIEQDIQIEKYRDLKKETEAFNVPRSVNDLTRCELTAEQQQNLISLMGIAKLRNYIEKIEQFNATHSYSVKEPYTRILQWYQADQII